MRIAAVAHRVPSRKVDNQELLDIVRRRNAGRYDRASQAVLLDRLRTYLAQTGARSRYWRAEGEKSVTLGLEAGAQALAASGVRPGDIDLLIFVGVGRGWIEPAMANLFLAELGLGQATGFDLVDACASWLRALDLVACLIRAGRCRRALLLNCECNVREYCEFDVPNLDRLEYLLPGFTIGEAATATVLTDESPEDGYHARFRTWGSYHGLCRIPLPNQEEYRIGTAENYHAALSFYAYGTPLVQTTMRRVVATYRADPRFASLRPDICFGHTVSESVTTDVERLIGLPPGTAFRTLPEYGNTVSASLPLAMSLADRADVLHRGQTVLFVMGSAGVSVGLVTLLY